MHFFNQIAYFKEIVLDRKFLVSELGKILDVLNHLKNEFHAQVEILKLIVELALVTSKVYSIYDDLENITCSVDTVQRCFQVMQDFC